eukprot:15355634-Heterocapsa_arctica.AAC.1
MLGLGAIFAEHRYNELEDLPVIINELEKGLRRHNSESKKTKRHAIAESEWDEYDEIWGFDDVPRGFPDYGVH